MQAQLEFLRWIVPVVCVASLLLILISVAVAGLILLPRYIRGLVLAESQRQHAHSQTNGFKPSVLTVSNGFQPPRPPVPPPVYHFPLSLEESLITPIVKKKHKKHKKPHVEGENNAKSTEVIERSFDHSSSPPRVVPGRSPYGLSPKQQ
ncbi:hypothetical protein BV898_07150 [Hypsibius exemplaris]|uniref:Uncharacterized protein n=1 Tax=Hypsibius exemplaris TaxID=2072580 RepID=A0A1W0WU35_HYPEX|nr:hypothetical protein BV898_07150 [Hypsibius exemplaris]